ncbi:MAG: hypothetical protein HY063_13035 [Bacteroidetes bacterium]|nr:hypothetical protein [Bacteroidota bacterium]
MNYFIKSNFPKGKGYAFSELKEIITAFPERSRVDSTSIFYNKNINATLSFTKREDFAYEVLIQTTDTSITDALNTTLIKYINTQPLVLKLLSENNKKNKKMIDFVSPLIQKIKETDIKELKYDAIEALIKLQKLKIQSEYENESLRGYEIIAGPFISENTYKSPKYIIIFLFTLTGFLLGAVLAYISEFFKSTS